MFANWSHADLIAIGAIFASLAVGVAIVRATFLGPVVATREADARRLAADQRAAKMRVFRDLMGHRYDIKHPNYVAALNLIQIEFAGDGPVINAFTNYLEAFKAEHSEKPNCLEMRHKAVIRLLTSVAEDLGYQLEQLDLMEQVYAPQGWADQAQRQALVLGMFADMATGKYALPVMAYVPQEFVEDLGDDCLAVRTISTPPPPRKRARKP